MSEAALATPPGRPWNHNSSRGFQLSVAIPLVAIVAIRALVMVFGIEEMRPSYEIVPWSPPPWVADLVWCLIYPMWGAARWYAYQTGLAGRRASFWVVAVMAWGLLFPFVTAGPSVLWGAAAALVSLALAAFAAWRLWRVSKRASCYVVPSLAWLGFATALAVAAIVYT